MLITKQQTKRKNIMATKTKKAPVKVVGVSEMTREKHNFDGFAVRAQKSGYHFRQYVSASTPKGAKKKEVRSMAYDSAVALRLMLGNVLAEKKSWRGGELTKAAMSVITGAGFKIEKK